MPARGWTTLWPETVPVVITGCAGSTSEIGVMSPISRAKEIAVFASSVLRLVVTLSPRASMSPLTAAGLARVPAETARFSGTSEVSPY